MARNLRSETSETFSISIPANDGVGGGRDINGFLLVYRARRPKLRASAYCKRVFLDFFFIFCDARFSQCPLPFALCFQCLDFILYALENCILNLTVMVLTEGLSTAENLGNHGRLGPQLVSKLLRYL